MSLINKKSVLGFFLVSFFIFSPLEAASFQILNINISEITDNSAIITFQTNETSKGMVKFGLEKDNYIYWTYSEYDQSTSHQVALTNLLPETTYHFKVMASSLSGEQIFSNDLYFKTEKYKDIYPPKIKDIKIVSVTATTATISWETDEPAKDTFKYGTTQECKKQKKTSAYQTFHEIDLTGLSSSTQYYFYFESRDSSGNVGSSGILNFITDNNVKADKEPLSISYISPISDNDQNITENSAIISWRTNRITTGEICWGEGTRCRNTIKSKPPKKLEHFFVLENLKPNTTYIFKITSSDIFGNKVSSSNLFFTTKQTPPPSNESNENISNNNSSLNNEKTENPVPSPIIQSPSPHEEFFPPSFYTKPTALVKAKGDDKIYAIYNNKKHWIPGPSVFENYGYYWSNVKIIDSAKLAQYKDVTLVKTPDKATVYLLEGKTKRPIYSAEVFEKMGYKWSDIITISYSDLNTYSDGPLLK